jgi:hypothetical protein
MLSQRSTFSSIWWKVAATTLLVASSCYPDFDSLSSEWGGAAGKTSSAGSGGSPGAGGDGTAAGPMNGGEDTGGTSAAGHPNGGSGGSTTTQGGEGGEAGTVDMPPPCTPAELPDAAGPVAAYDLNEGSGNVIGDSSASKYDAALAGGAWVATGHTKGGIKFSSEGQRITLPAEALNSLDELTVTAWVNLTSAPAGSTLLDIGTDADNHLALQVSDGTNLRLVVKTATVAVTLTGTYAVPLNRWTQVAFTLGDGKATIYLDGRPFARGDVALKPSDLGATARAWVGQARGTGANLLGTIDDLAFYGRVLDQRELMREVLVDSDDLYFTFDEFCSEGTMDLPAQGPRKGASKLPTGGTLVEGRVGQAVRLDASASQFVELPHGVVNDCTDNLTIAAWVYMDTVNTWARMFDLGTGTNTFMYLSPTTPYGTIRFAAKLNAPDSTAEQVLSRNGLLPVGAWHHLAVVLSKNTGTLYLDGDEGAKNTKITMNPSDMGDSRRNWLGRSQYDIDPYFNGKFDELVISCRPFTVDEVRLLSEIAP